MRERCVRVDTTKLEQLSKLYTSKKVAEQLGVSKQVFSFYKLGQRDMPESRVDKLCSIYQLDKAKMIVDSI